MDISSGTLENKTGQKKQKDISANAAVERGVRMEPALRELYATMNPQMQVEHYPYDILAQSERPWLTATLDGELTDENGRHGILEIKTGQLMKKLTMRSGRTEMCRFTTSPKHNGSYWLLDGILLICLPRFRTSVVTGQYEHAESNEQSAKKTLHGCWAKQTHSGDTSKSGRCRR